MGLRRLGGRGRQPSPRRVHLAQLLPHVLPGIDEDPVAVLPAVLHLALQAVRVLRLLQLPQMFVHQGRWLLSLALSPSLPVLSDLLRSHVCR